MKFTPFVRSLVMTFLIVFISSVAASAQTTAFTYQGRLTDASMPVASGTYDFEFALYDANGTLVASNSTATTGITVANGSFTVKLDFGLSAFNGADRHLEIRVKKPTDSNYTPLSPRQQINSAPYAIRSLSAGTADTATNATNAANANNADTLDNIDSSSFLQTNTTAFIRNQTSLQSADFNVTGTGSANIINAQTQYNINGSRLLSIAGTNNLFAGINAGISNTTGNSNSFFGYNVGYKNTTGYFNSFFGESAGRDNTTGLGNSFFGSSSGIANTTGVQNSFFGDTSGINNTTGNFNLFVGAGAAIFNTTGSNNSFVGHLAGFKNTTGSNNSFFGPGAGDDNKTGNNNTIIGHSANVGADNLNYATAIGADAVVSTSNTVVLGRTADTVIAPNLLQVNALGTDGSTPLCRNSLNQISTCTAQAALTENKGDVNAATINTLREQIKQQQQEIDDLKKKQQQIDALIQLVCSQNTKADVCKQK